MAKVLINFADFTLHSWTECWVTAPTEFASYVTGRWGSPYRANIAIAGTSSSYPCVTYMDTGDIGTNYIESAYVASYYSSDLNGRGYMVQIGDGTVGCQLTLVITHSTNTVSVYRGTSSGTLLQSASGGAVLNRAANAWNDIQFAWKIDPSVGYIWLRVNGTVLLNTSNANTRNTANTRWNRTVVAGVSDNAYTGDIGWFDLGGDAASTLHGAYRAFWAYPTGDNAVQMTPNSGTNNFSRVNNDDSDTTYVSSTTAGQIDRLDISSSWVSTGADIAALKVMYKPRIDDATARTLRNKLWSNSVAANGTTYSAASTYGVKGALLADLILLDPNTAAAWGTGNAAQTVDVGYELIS